jgi:drug/metabolite transporter (DMT)-like permease
VEEIGTFLALASALTFGAADFAGGLAARRSPVIGVTVLSQLAGGLLLIPALAVFGGALSGQALVTGGIAGLAGGGGLALYLRALAIGPMGVASPLAGVVGAALPVGFGLLLGERLPALAIAGALLALVAVVLASSSAAVSIDDVAQRLRGPLLALVAGLAFGGFFVALDASPPDSGLWPLVGARISSLLLLATVLVLRRRALPERSALPLVALTGLLDMAANVLFLAATRSGLLSLAALLASLYPVVVALLARAVLKERLVGRQRVGVLLCLIAIGLIAVS